MPENKKLNCLVLMLSVILLLSASRVFATFESESAQEKTLRLITNVANFDVSKYNVTLTFRNESYPAEWGGNVLREELRYHVEKSDSECVVTCVYLNGSLNFCMFGWHEGTPLYSSPQSTNSVDYVKAALQRLQTCIGSSRYQPLIDLIDVARASPVTFIPHGGGTIPALVASSGGMTIEIVNYTSGISAGITGLNWLYTINGAEKYALQIQLKRGTLYTLRDDTGIFSVSDAEVKVSMDQAINLAIEHAQNFSWVTSDYVTAKADVIPRELATAELHYTNSPTRNPLVFYPYWKVDLWLGKTYPGGVTFIEVGIWGDTSAVHSIKALGSGGGETPPTSEPNSPAATPTPAISTSPASTPLIQQQTPALTDGSPSADDQHLGNTPMSTNNPQATSVNSQTLTPQDGNDSPTPFLGPAIAVVAGTAAVALAALYQKKRGK